MLDNVDLARAVGGADSGDFQCPHQGVADTGAKACEAPAVVVTAAGG